MQLKQNTSVLTADGRGIGHLGRVVVDPQSRTITHIVVHQGVLFVEDKVVPIDYVAQATEDQITLRHEAGDLRTLPLFEEQHEVLVDEGLPQPAVSPPGDPALSGMAAGFADPAPPGPRVRPQIEQNIPDGTVALKEGAKVFTADGKHEGSVESLAAEPQTRRITHLRIAKGLLTRERRTIPVAWVILLGEDEIHLSVDQQTLEAVSVQPN
jgi:sporulation protein YlmC with PRC-barrel domain